MTQDQLAELAGVNVNTIRALESGGDTKISTLRAVAFALRVSEADLLEPETVPPARVLSGGHEAAQC